MSIARILGGKDERRTKTRACREQSPISIAMAGNATAEVFITHQWLRDSPKTPPHSGPGGHWQANRSSNENKSLLALVNAAQVGALGTFRNHGSPQLVSAVTDEINQNIHSPGRQEHASEGNALRWPSAMLLDSCAAIRKLGLKRVLGNAPARTR
jgi:hypothetical protein